MSDVILVVTVIVILGLFALVMLSSKGGEAVQTPNLRYRLRQGPLLNGAEATFLKLARELLPDTVTIACLVRVADVIEPSVQRNVKGSGWLTLFNRISSKHFDFVICSGPRLIPICAVEIDGPTHRQRARQARDVFLNGACQAAGLKLLRISADDPMLQNKSLLKATLDEVLQPSESQRAA